MEFLKLIEQRESCRSYKKEPISRDKLDAVISAARLAPSACNSQPWKFIVVDEAEVLDKMPSAIIKEGVSANRFTPDASAFIVVCETKAKLAPTCTCHSQFFAQMDIGIATAYLSLAATDMGLSNCIIGWFDEGKVKDILNIPEDVTVRLIISLGNSSGTEPRKKTRKDSADILSYNKW